MMHPFSVDDTASKPSRVASWSLWVGNPLQEKKESVATLME
jgi:hypothetical protein